MTQPNPELFDTAPFAFGPGFLKDHAGQIITEPRIAVVELIANAYDAGATEVLIRWPDMVDGEFEIIDNGTGMTFDEFNRRWKTLSYSRSIEQGQEVQFPEEVHVRPRTAFGQSGKGRHGAFCFADKYSIETWKNGKAVRATIELINGGIEPFRCSVGEQFDRNGHGTKISAVLVRGLIGLDQINEWVGSKFLVDPEFSIFVNGTKLELLSLTALRTHDIEVPDVGNVKIHQIEAPQQDRTTRLRGITWWVNGRMVGQPSWSGLESEGALLDGRTGAAKRFSFVVEADCLKSDVKQDWSGFYDSPGSLKVREVVRDNIIKNLGQLLANSRKERKKAILGEHRKILKELPMVSRKVIGQFVDEVQQSCPSLSEGDLSRTVTVLTKLENSRSGYDLLTKLADCSPDDLDTWNQLMGQWTANNAEVVLNELGKRLRLISDLEKLVHVSTADELHDLQPLFARGLWMFGPEFEAIDFTSNRSMATVIRDLLGGTDSNTAKLRPDFVALPDRSIGVYSSDSFGEDSEVNGIRKVVIIELKKGGFEIGTKEIRQGEDYAFAIRKAHSVHPDTQITVFVLGASRKDVEERKIGDMTKVIPFEYRTLLRRAHGRTFHLQKKLTQVVPVSTSDKEVEEIVAAAPYEEQISLF